MPAHVSSLFIYPLKSAAGTAVSEIELDELGAVYDRRWMLVDANDKCITQREAGALALIHPYVTNEGLRLEYAGRDALNVAFPTQSATVRTVVVWDDTVPALDAGNEASEWCTAVLGMECRLVYIAPFTNRPLAPKHTGSVSPEGRHVMFSDGAPLLLLGANSLVALNEKLTQKGVGTVGVDRFRPNIVISESNAHDEDTWRTIQIGDVTIGVGAPCPRCVMTTINQQLGKRSPAAEGEPGGEPLRTLASYRRQGTGVMFGMNATHALPGTVRVGDAVRVIETR